MERLSQPDADDATAWLEVACPHGSVTGYDVGGWEASIWVPHAMYETAELPEGLTHDDVRRIEKAALEGVEPTRELTDFEAALEEILDDEGSWQIGSPLGVSSAPGDGWRRLLWTELAERLDVDPWALDVPPCFRSFPFRSWPANIRPPAEGSLDREQLAHVVEHLAAVSAEGLHATCWALIANLTTSEVGAAKIVFTGELGDLLGLYDESDFGPANIWPADQSWLTYTDNDLWATRVDGPRELIELLRDDPEVEAVELPFNGDNSAT